MAGQVKEDNMKVVKLIHYGIIASIFLSIAVFAGLFYVATEKKEMQPSQHYTTDSNQGTAKPLPDFIVDKLEPNELEQLKP